MPKPKRALFLAACLCCATAGAEPYPGWLSLGKPVALPPPSAIIRNNPARLVPAPPGFLPRVPKGFQVSVFARGFALPRWLALTPHGDVLVADADAGQVICLRDPAHRGVATEREILADRLALPFGIALRNESVYVAEHNRIIRFRYDPTTCKPSGEREAILDLPPAVTASGPGLYPHWTRPLAFSRDGKTLFVAVGSKTNQSLEDDPARAVILACDPDRKQRRVYARGVRNAVGIQVNPETGRLWASVNERGNLGDQLPPDYFTEIREDGFYGFPYAYVGPTKDARVQPPRPDLAARTLTPDVLLAAHISPLQFTFYEGAQFPAWYRHGAFIANHGSSNRSRKVGYDVIFVPFRNGRPSADPVVFLTGLVPDPARAEAYGRPVGAAVAADGSLLVSDDGARLIWRVAFSR